MDNAGLPHSVWTYWPLRLLNCIRGLLLRFASTHCIGNVRIAHQPIKSSDWSCICSPHCLKPRPEVCIHLHVSDLIWLNPRGRENIKNSETWAVFCHQTQNNVFNNCKYPTQNVSLYFNTTKHVQSSMTYDLEQALHRTQTQTQFLTIVSYSFFRLEGFRPPTVVFS